jgi:hypothetical protein
VELIGKKSRVGIDQFLKKSDGGISFADLLQPFTPADHAETDPFQKELEERLECARRQISAVPLAADVSQLPGEDLFDVTLRSEAGKLKAMPNETEVHCWPITLPESNATAVTGATPLAYFPRLSFSALTSFFAFRVTAKSGSRQACLRFVLNVPLIGAPSDRRDRILRTLLSTPEKVLRFLMFLLSEFGADGGAIETAGDAIEGGGPFRWGSGETPLFETLLKALDHSPGKIDQVAALVEDLRKSGENLLPEGFDEVWQPVWEARQKEHA